MFLFQDIVFVIFNNKASNTMVLIKLRLLDMDKRNVEKFLYCTETYITKLQNCNCLTREFDFNASRRLKERLF